MTRWRQRPNYYQRAVYIPYSEVAAVSPRPADVPEVMPITREQVKQQARVDTDAEDELIDLHLQAAVDLVERQTGYWLGQRAVDAYIPCLDYDETVFLPGGRVGSVTEIAYRDEDGVEQTWSAANYALQAFPTYSSVRLVDGAALFPYSYLYNENRQAVRIRYVAGHASVSDIPVGLRQAALMIAAELYNEREAHRTQPGVIAVANPAAMTLMQAYKIHWPL